MGAILHLSPGYGCSSAAVAGSRVGTAYNPSVRQILAEHLAGVQCAQADQTLCSQSCF